MNFFLGLILVIILFEIIILIKLIKQFKNIKNDTFETFKVLFDKKLDDDIKEASLLKITKSILISILKIIIFFSFLISLIFLFNLINGNFTNFLFSIIGVIYTTIICVIYYSVRSRLK